MGNSMLFESTFAAAHMSAWQLRPDAQHDNAHLDQLEEASQPRFAFCRQLELQLSIQLVREHSTRILLHKGDDLLHLLFTVCFADLSLLHHHKAHE